MRYQISPLALMCFTALIAHARQVGLWNRQYHNNNMTGLLWRPFSIISFEDCSLTCWHAARVVSGTAVQPVSIHVLCYWIISGHWHRKNELIMMHDCVHTSTIMHNCLALESCIILYIIMDKRIIRPSLFHTTCCCC